MSWIQTYQGGCFEPFNPHPDQIHIRDIAHALALTCRFTGHCLDFYSVAQHSVMVSQIVSHKHALAGLLHDASEAYLTDVASPIKH
jgi:5'-deoxynucleotidase YfbR-like HD superfamily hydrolase